MKKLSTIILIIGFIGLAGFGYYHVRANKSDVPTTPVSANATPVSANAIAIPIEDQRLIRDKYQAAVKAAEVSQLAQKEFEAIFNQVAGRARIDTKKYQLKEQPDKTLVFELLPNASITQGQQ